MESSADNEATLSRKQRERERHRQEILKIAERIFAEKGYHATTIEEIAKESQFAVGTLYNLFGGKEDLYKRVIENFCRQFMADFEQKVISLDDPEAAISALIELRLTHFNDHRAFIRLMLDLSPGSCVNPVQAFPPDVVEMHDRYVAAIEQIFQRGIADGTFDQADPLYLTLCLEGIINAFVAYWSRHDATEPLDVRISKIRRGFIERIKLRLPVE